VVRLAVVGSRTPTPYGNRLAAGLAGQLAGRGIEVVSGGASLSVVAPTGQYVDSRFVNIGMNRWAFKPEVGLTWRLFHRDDYLAPVTGADRDRLAVVEKRLMALGLKQGRW